MKTKIALLGLVIVLCGTSNISAQWYIGGALSLNGGNSKDKIENENAQDNYKQSFFYLSPKAGYFLSDNFMVGMGFNLGSQKYESELENGIDTYYKSESHSKYFSIEPYARYYIPLTEKLSFMNHLGFLYGFSNSYSANYQDNAGSKNYSEGTGKEIGIEYYPGISLNITEKLLVELGIGAIGYSHSKSESTPKTEYNDSNIIDEGEKETNTSGSYYMVYNNIRLGMAFKF